MFIVLDSTLLRNACLRFEISHRKLFFREDQNVNNRCELICVNVFTRIWLSNNCIIKKNDKKTVGIYLFGFVLIRVIMKWV